MKEIGREGKMTGEQARLKEWEGGEEEGEKEEKGGEGRLRKKEHT